LKNQRKAFFFNDNSPKRLQALNVRHYPEAAKEKILVDFSPKFGIIQTAPKGKVLGPAGPVKSSQS
jgi:hypothetical protein